MTDASDSPITALAWRPDGKILAVSYENGKIELFDVEHHQPILTMGDIKQTVTFMRWSSCGNSEAYEEYNVNSNENTEWEFLTKFPSLSKAFSYNPSKQEEIQTCRKLCTEMYPSILICGTKNGQIYPFMSGHLQMGYIGIVSTFDIPNVKRQKKIIIHKINFLIKIVVFVQSWMSVE